MRTILLLSAAALLIVGCGQTSEEATQAESSAPSTTETTEAPATEAKFMRCISGAIYDVIVDMRPDSDTYLQHFGTELSVENRRALYVPEMFAHGYLALTDGAQAYYSASEFYTPGVEQGLRYDDPALGIQWPQPVTIVSEKDAGWPLIQR